MVTKPQTYTGKTPVVSWDQHQFELERKKNISI